MHYMGGKSRIAKQLTEVILEYAESRDVLVEPFMGAANMTVALAPHFDRVYAYDIHEDLILMWRAVQNGWVPPTETSKEEYYLLKDSSPSPLRGFLGFGMSFGGKWFAGYTGGGNPQEIEEVKRLRPGSQSNYIKPARNGVMKLVDHSNITVTLSSYLKIPTPRNAVIYCDPPYQQTTGYKHSFDHGEFWKTMDEWSATNQVFVSSEQAPSNWETIWEKQVKGTLNKNSNVQPRTEKLFFKQ